MPFVLMPFLNGEPIDTPEFGSVFYGQVDNETFAARIPMTITVPDTIGLHYLSVLVIPYPETPRCFARDSSFSNPVLIGGYINAIPPRD